MFVTELTMTIFLRNFVTATAGLQLFLLAWRNTSIGGCFQTEMPQSPRQISEFCPIVPDALNTRCHFEPSFIG